MCAVCSEFFKCLKWLLPVSPCRPSVGATWSPAVWKRKKQKASFSHSFRASGWRLLDTWSSLWFWSQRLCRNRLPELHLTCRHSKFSINSAAFITLDKTWKIFDGRASGFKVSLTFSAMIFHHPSMFILNSGPKGVGVYPNYVRVKVRWHCGHVSSSSSGHTERQKTVLTLIFTFTNNVELPINWMLTCILEGVRTCGGKPCICLGN